MNNEKTSERKIHVALPDDIHQRMRVKCALEDRTIQDYVAQLIESDVKDINLPLDAKSKAAKAGVVSRPSRDRQSKGSKKIRTSKAE